MSKLSDLEKKIAALKVIKKQIVAAKVKATKEKYVKPTDGKSGHK